MAGPSPAQLARYTRRLVGNARWDQIARHEAARCVSTATASDDDLSRVRSPPPSSPVSTTAAVPSKRREAVRDAKPFSEFLTDNFNRQHDYLRISITERCNLRCLYCMPEDGVQLSPPAHLLTTPEIFYLSSLFVSQGVTKIRLTGGEPTVRKDVMPLMRQIGSLRSKGLKELALTTNGISLYRKLDSMVETGLTGINLSLDTLDPFQFQIMTRRKGFDAVMKSIDRILEMNRLGANLKLKINCVVMRGMNEREIIPFVEMGREKDVEVRFIEYMPFGGNKWSKGKMLSYQEMLGIIRTKYPEIGRIPGHKNDTSKTFKVPGFVGRVGFITSMTDDFCGTCNRLRITGDGNLKVCLHGNTEVSLRDILREGNDGKPIDETAFESLKELELTRHLGNLPEGTPLGWGPREERLLDIIGRAVKRKKEKHAGMGELENMENRPMILIDAAASQRLSTSLKCSARGAVRQAPWSRVPIHMLRSLASLQDAHSKRHYSSSATQAAAAPDHDEAPQTTKRPPSPLSKTQPETAVRGQSRGREPISSCGAIGGKGISAQREGNGRTEMVHARNAKKREVGNEIAEDLHSSASFHTDLTSPRKTRSGIPMSTEKKKEAEDCFSVSPMTEADDGMPAAQSGGLPVSFGRQMRLWRNSQRRLAKAMEMPRDKGLSKSNNQRRSGAFRVELKKASDKILGESNARRGTEELRKKLGKARNENRKAGDGSVGSVIRKSSLKELHVPTSPSNDAGARAAAAGPRPAKASVKMLEEAQLCPKPGELDRVVSAHSRRDLGKPKVEARPDKTPLRKSQPRQPQLEVQMSGRTSKLAIKEIQALAMRRAMGIGAVEERDRKAIAEIKARGAFQARSIPKAKFSEYRWFNVAGEWVPESELQRRVKAKDVVQVAAGSAESDEERKLIEKLYFFRVAAFKADNYVSTGLSYQRKELKPFHLQHEIRITTDQNYKAAMYPFENFDWDSLSFTALRQNEGQATLRFLAKKRLDARFVPMFQLLFEVIKCWRVEIWRILLGLRMDELRTPGRPNVRFGQLAKYAAYTQARRAAGKPMMRHDPLWESVVGGRNLSTEMSLWLEQDDDEAKMWSLTRKIYRKHADHVAPLAMIRKSLQQWMREVKGNEDGSDDGLESSSEADEAAHQKHMMQFWQQSLPVFLLEANQWVKQLHWDVLSARWQLHGYFRRIPWTAGDVLEQKPFISLQMVQKAHASWLRAREDALQEKARENDHRQWLYFRQLDQARREKEQREKDRGRAEDLQPPLAAEEYFHHTEYYSRQILLPLTSVTRQHAIRDGEQRVQSVEMQMRIWRSQLFELFTTRTYDDTRSWLTWTTPEKLAQANEEWRSWKSWANKEISRTADDAWFEELPSDTDVDYTLSRKDAGDGINATGTIQFDPGTNGSIPRIDNLIQPQLADADLVSLHESEPLGARETVDAPASRLEKCSGQARHEHQQTGSERVAASARQITRPSEQPKESSTAPRGSAQTVANGEPSPPPLPSESKPSILPNHPQFQSELPSSPPPPSPPIFIKGPLIPSQRLLYPLIHTPDPDKLSPATSQKPGSQLPHLNASGEAHMVSISGKSASIRAAVAVGTVSFSAPNTAEMVAGAALKKGDVLATARIAGIQAAKLCPMLVPLCHPIMLSHVAVKLRLLRGRSGGGVCGAGKMGGKLGEEDGVGGAMGGVGIEARVECVGTTGVEMEALTAVMGAALTVVDMVKAVDKGACIGAVRVVLKEGGRSGRWIDEDWAAGRQKVRTEEGS